jgi:hypothetical protein
MVTAHSSEMYGITYDPTHCNNPEVNHLSPDYLLTELDDKGIPGVTSPPHSLAVSSHSATWVTITWQPPEFSQPAEQLSYK